MNIQKFAAPKNDFHFTQLGQIYTLPNSCRVATNGSILYISNSELLEACEDWTAGFFEDGVKGTERKYPNIQEVLKTKDPNSLENPKIVIIPLAIIPTLRALSKMTDENYHKITLDFSEGELKLTGQREPKPEKNIYNQIIAPVYFEVLVPLSVCNIEYTITYNINYLITMLEAGLNMFTFGTDEQRTTYCRSTTSKELGMIMPIKAERNTK